jgi:hypothetical protein
MPVHVAFVVDKVIFRNFCSKNVHFSLLVSIHHCSVSIHLSITDVM